MKITSYMEEEEEDSDYTLLMLKVSLTDHLILAGRTSKFLTFDLFKIKRHALALQCTKFDVHNLNS